MVTLPSEAASDRDLARSLTAAGMDAARINSAHDDLAAWMAMAAHIRAASDDAGRGVPILVDLPGPKLRTRPDRARARGRPPTAASRRARGGGRARRAWLTCEGADAPPPEARAVLPVARAWLAALAPGDRVALTDARGRHRNLLVGACLRRRGAGPSPGGGPTSSAARRLTAEGTAARYAPLGRLARRAAALGSRRRRYAGAQPRSEPRRQSCDALDQPARVRCTLAVAFGAVARGESVWFDDGKIGGVVRASSPTSAQVEIAVTRRAGDAAARRQGHQPARHATCTMPALTAART